LSGQVSRAGPWPGTGTRHAASPKSGRRAQAGGPGLGSVPPQTKEAAQLRRPYCNFGGCSSPLNQSLYIGQPHWIDAVALDALELAAPALQDDEVHSLAALWTRRGLKVFCHDAHAGLTRT